MPLSTDPERRAAQLANMQQPGQPSNALKHGLRSEVVLKPLREQADVWARRRWPWLDDTRRALVSDLAARVERIRQWSDTTDILLQRKAGVHVHPVIESAHGWQARLDLMIRGLDAEAREREAVDAESVWVDELEEGRRRWAELKREVRGDHAPA